MAALKREVRSVKAECDEMVRERIRYLQELRDVKKELEEHVKVIQCISDGNENTRMMPNRVQGITHWRQHAQDMPTSDTVGIEELQEYFIETMEVMVDTTCNAKCDLSEFQQYVIESAQIAIKTVKNVNKINVNAPNNIPWEVAGRRRRLTQKSPTGHPAVRQVSQRQYTAKKNTHHQQANPPAVISRGTTCVTHKEGSHPKTPSTLTMGRSAVTNNAQTGTRTTLTMAGQSVPHTHGHKHQPIPVVVGGTLHTERAEVNARSAGQRNQVIVIGTSLVRGLSLELNKLGHDAIGYTNPGCRIEHIMPRVNGMVPHKFVGTLLLLCAGNDCEVKSASKSN